MLLTEHPPGKMLLLFLLSFALPPRAETGDIIGGHETKPHSRPYMAYLKIYGQESKSCGGFLIQEDVVMTAAHCNGRKIEVILGTNNIGKRRNWLMKISVNATFPHQGYNKDTFSNDIMLLKLREKVKLTKKINLLSLPDPLTHLEPGQLCSVAGWGQTTFKGKTSDKLMEVELKIQKEEKCKRIYNNYNSKTQLCAGDKKGGNIMKGDYGDPLVCDNVAQGIMTFRDKNGIFPGIYTRISFFMPWIKKTLKRICGNNLPQRKIKVILGTNNIGKIWNWPRKFSVKKTIPHEGYNKDTHSNDIMLLKALSSASLSKMDKFNRSNPSPLNHLHR
ncbi:mast cell protease 8-like [Sorex fumeus]|uniref:mast cell protease 8-like n=1 Tax=Sorex fumeus TaxID=62283 RepID=UPI0024AD7F05|nr:mast cell protease 8-like [Sorex fumeus]